MNANQDSRAEGYEAVYEQFDSALMRRIRREAYGEDVGQHSWVSAEELRADVGRLRLTAESRLLDLGCGPCGPLTFMLSIAGCRGVGLELSPAAVQAGRARASQLGVAHQLSLRTADLNDPLPFEAETFDAVMSLDVILHVRERAQLYGEVARVLSRDGRFLVTDAGVLTGELTQEEGRRRSAYGYAQFMPPGRNEALLQAAGLRVIATEDRTATVVKNAGGRLAATKAHRSELEELMDADEVQKQIDYLEVVVELARRGALSRMMYLAELRARP